MTQPMTDEQLADYLCLTEAEAAIVIPKLTQERRSLFDRMAEVEVEIDLWVAGLGPKPKGVLIDGPRKAVRLTGEKKR